MRARPWILIAILLVATQAFVLYLMGQPPMSTTHFLMLWAGDVHGVENSQQLTDWYSFSHIIHGILFYLGLRFFFPRMSVAKRFALAVGIEVSWELIENSPWIINRYREQALAQGYFGDSDINSISDTLMMVVGFLFAWRAPVAPSVALIIFFEAFTMYEIRDGLTLNIIQLIHPVQWISNWQAGI